jgi:hypothetical protein
MSADHPIGDPVGGAAYGERNDPISAIVAISSMVGTYAAAGSFAAMTLMQGLTFVGSALSLVGNVTGNSTLSKIGMIAGLAGGIGQFADYAMGTQMGGTLGQLGNKMGLNNVTGFSNVSIPTDALAMTRDQFASNSGAYGGVTPKGFVEGVSSSGTSVPYTAGYNPNSAGALANPAGTAVQAGTAVPAAAAPAATAPPAATGSVAPPSFETLKDAGKGVLRFTKENPDAAAIIAKSVGGLADWMSGKTDAEIAALKSQVGYADARAMQIQQEIEKEKTRRIRINEGYANVNTGGLNVNTNALMQSPSIAAPTVALPGQGGLINTARIG